MRRLDKLAEMSEFPTDENFLYRLELSHSPDFCSSLYDPAPAAFRYAIVIHLTSFFGEDLAMYSLLPRIFTLAILLLVIGTTAGAQVVFTDDFEANNVGDVPAGWTVLTGSVGYSVATAAPVYSGVRAVRLSSGISTAAEIKVTTAITNDYVYEYYVLIPDTGLVNETIGYVKVEGVGMSFGLGATTSEGNIFFSTSSDGFSVSTNVWHHVKVEVDYQKNVLQTTVDGLASKKYPASISTSSDLRLAATSISSVLQKHIVYIDSVTVSLMTVDLTPAPVALSNPANGATGQGASTAPSFSWTSVSQSTGYTLQISTDSTFATGIVYDDTTITGTSKSVPLPPLNAATTYFWRVKAKNTVGWGDWSTVRTFRTVDPPAAPVLYNPSDAQQTYYIDPLYFYWSTPSGTDAFQLQIAEDSLFTTIVHNDSATSSSSTQYVSFPPLEILKHYYWRVRSLGTAGWGDWSTVFDFYTPQPLNPPTLSSPANGANISDLNYVYTYWSSVSYATDYHIEIATDSLFTQIVVSDTSVGSTAQYQYFPPLAYNTVYYWRVRSASVGGWSAFSGFRWFRTKPAPTTTLSSPANGSVEDDETIYFSGSTPYSDGADSMRIQIALDTAFTQLVVDTTGDGTSFVLDITRFTPSTTYYWRMSAHNVAGWGTYSARRNFSIGPLPVAPTLSSPANNAIVTDVSVYFTWSNNGALNIQDYRLQIATDSLFTNIVLDTVASYSGFYAGEGRLVINARYYWRMRTRTNVGNSPYSAYRSFLTPQPPAMPSVVLPVAGSMDVYGVVTIRWSSTVGKDSSHIMITTDTSSHPAKLLGRTTGAALDHNSRVTYHYGPVSSGFASTTVTFGSTGTQLTINGQGFQDPLFVTPNQQVFIRVKDFSEAGESPWSSWSWCSTLRPPTVPTGAIPVNGATGVPFLETRFQCDVSTVARSHVNATLSTFPDMSAPFYEAQMYPGYGEESNYLYTYGPDLQSNTSYYYQLEAYNEAGSVFSPIYIFQTADPAAVFTCVMDVPGDQGGFIDLDFIASQLDQGCSFSGTSESPICVFDYSVWRLHDPYVIGAYRVEEIRKQVEKLPAHIRAALASMNSTDVWEPITNFPAIGEASYRVTVRSRADSGKNGTNLQRFSVIAHALNGMLFRAAPWSGYSVDNLAPAAPVGGQAVVEGGQVRVTWVANDEADLKEYVIYRSLNQNDPVSSLTPIGTTTETQFVDATPPSVATAYYFVVARDKNENNGEPAIITAHIVTGVESIEGIPTEFVLGQNFPNPFNPSTTIRFGLPERSTVHIEVINTLGQVVDQLVDADLPAGYFQSVWNARVPSGLYFARIVATPVSSPDKPFRSIKKMLLLR